VAERFELYIGGLELANGFSELTDAVEQRQRFIQAQKLRAKQNYAAYPLPEKFLTSMADLPASAGIALGIDRLAMLFAGVSGIDDIITFTPESL
jgi:lysyl-tRNA synthetase class 2